MSGQKDWYFLIRALIGLNHSKMINLDQWEGLLQVPVTSGQKVKSNFDMSMGPVDVDFDGMVIWFGKYSLALCVILLICLTLSPIVSNCPELSHALSQIVSHCPQLSQTVPNFLTLSPIVPASIALCVFLWMSYSVFNYLWLCVFLPVFDSLCVFLYFNVPLSQ